MHIITIVPKENQTLHEILFVQKGVVSATAFRQQWANVVSRHYPGKTLGQFLNFDPIISSHYSYEFMGLLGRDPSMPFKVVVGDMLLFFDQCEEVIKAVEERKKRGEWVWPPPHMTEEH